ncbi:MAG: GNAT family N-acetyltransferase [Nanoarchaeota archaeon]|nr:GNAT family N-acetyltransferase [Nanoarchaeota archaeon]
MGLKIRKAQKKDIKEILELQKSYSESYWKEEDFERAIKDKLVIFLVAEEEHIVGSILGFITPSKRTDAMLHETRVHKKYQKKGIGKALVDEFCKRIFKKGVKDIYAQITEEHIPFYIKSCKFKKSDSWIEVKKSQ